MYNQEEHCRCLSQGKDYWKEQFNKVAKILDNYANETNLSDEDRLYSIRNIVDSMLERPHQSVVKQEDKSQLRLEF
jgi:hypothetical protein